MEILRLSDNIIRLRKEKKITQETLADFIGVTKASVSKWETGQCLPDILLLPQLASFFDVSIDELIGYMPQLAPEQIRKIYLNFTSAFAVKPFEEVIGEVRATVKRYYSCYPLLLQICVLYLNHASLARGAEEVRGILYEARELCEHIISGCGDVAVCGDAISLKAVFNLQLGDAEAVIGTLEPVSNPARFSGQNDTLLIQAYLTAGLNDKAVDFIQVSIYLHILYLVGISTQYLAANTNNREGCYATIQRIDDVAEAYRLGALQPNAMAQFNYQSALTCLFFADNDGAMKRLTLYEDNILSLLDVDGCILHGDGYFNRLDSFIDSLVLGANPPRDKSFIKQSVVASLENPAFASLHDNDEFKLIIKRIEEK